MPWTKQQRKLFNAAAHDPEIAREHDISGREADKLADEANRLKKEGKEKKEKHDSFIDLQSVFGVPQKP